MDNTFARNLKQYKPQSPTPQAPDRACGDKSPARAKLHDTGYNACEKNSPKAL